MANQYQSQTVSGLGTIVTYTATSTSNLSIQGNITMPTASIGGTASQVVAVINKNASPVYTGVAGAEGFSKVVPVVATDVITIVLTSAATVDQGLNVIKTTISIAEGA